MAEFSLAQLRGRVRFRGDYQNTRRFSDADLNTEIQNGFKKFYQIVDDAHEGWWDTQGTVTTVASQAYIALPTGAWRVKAVAILDGSDYRLLRRIGREQRFRFGSSTERPSAYLLSARGIELFATPDAAYTLRVDYTPKAPELHESQLREFYNGWEDYAVEYALWKLDERESKPVTERLAALERIEKEVRAGTADRDQQEPEYIPLREIPIDIDDERWR